MSDLTSKFKLTISVVTPSFGQPHWLRLCAASVADQHTVGFEIEHIVQDALSGSEVADAIQRFPDVRLVSERDEGMYDAINRGWEKAHGDILCWLNCDEQYLPGTLERVAAYFRSHPETDILFADAIIVDNEGAYVCSRQVLRPQLYHTQTCHLQTFSCSTFFRSRVIREKGFRLDPKWKAAGDTELIIRTLKAGVKMDVLRKYTSTFVDHGENLGLQPQAQKEHRLLAAEAPFWVRSLHNVWRILHRLRRWRAGQYRPAPLSYDIYTLSSPKQRVRFNVPLPTFYWASRMQR